MLLRRALYAVLTVIVLQLSWTAISAYCLHETGRAAQHFGHHQHTETADELAALAKETPSAAQKAAPHAHCGSCAHTTLSPLELHQLALTEPEPRVAPVADLPQLSSTDTAPPERPQWSRAA